MGGERASVARGRINGALNQATIQANQIHIGTMGAYRQLDGEAGRLANEAAEMVGWCHGGDPPTYLSDACPKLLAAHASFKADRSTPRCVQSSRNVWIGEQHQQ
jgi:hypothetical protein